MKTINVIFKSLLSVTCCSLIVACGGSDDKKDPSDNPNDPTYLTFWKNQLEQFNKMERETGGFLDAMPAPVSTPSPADGALEDSDFSGTNVQVAGVDELDALKFDGEVLLSLNTTQNYYWHAEEYGTTTPQVRAFSEFMLEGQAEEDPSLHFTPERGQYYQGMVTHNGTTALLGTQDMFTIDPIVFFDCFRCYTPSNGIITLDIWQYRDASGPLPPEPTHIEIDGSYVSARSIDNKLYLVTTFSPEVEGFNFYPSSQSDIDDNAELIETLQMSDLVPQIATDGVSRSLFDEDACDIPTELNSFGYLPSVYVVTEIDMENPDSTTSLCLVDYVQETYVGLNNIYLLNNVYEDGNSQVSIRKIAITDNGLEYRGEGRVLGSLSGDGYQLGEVDGKFAIVNSVYRYSTGDGGISPPFFNDNDYFHQLTLLKEVDGALQVSAQIPNDQHPESIGKPGEQIYAVRFMGERAYVVTFDRVDPLYVIDLSNSDDPRIIGELEIPGFSDYLHVISDNLIFGIGKNAINDGATTWLQGLNVRLFDVSDPTNPTTLVNMDYGLRGSDSALLYDPHALDFTLNEETGIARLAFPVTIHGTEDDFDSELPPDHYYDWTASALLQLEIDTQTGTMSEVARYVYATPENTGADWFWSYGERSVINQSSIYFSHNSDLKVLEWGGSEVIRSFPVNNE